MHEAVLSAFDLWRFFNSQKLRYSAFSASRGSGNMVRLALWYLSFTCYII